ncbi:MAG: aminopeptidase N [Candidatus Ancillula sp.]|jgi:aminopeptidase N|nr:aminopeptidase N [Candidatus Ancillula sp.]
MPSDNLTQEEAQLRAQLVCDLKYDVYLDVTSSVKEAPDNLTFRSVSKISFKYHLDDIKHSTFVDLKAMSVNSIVLNGVALPSTNFSDHRIALPADLLQCHNVLEVDANCEYTNTGEGLHRYYADDEDQVYLYTQFEVADSRRVFAVFEQPDLKATFDFAVKAPSNWILTSTEPEISIEEIEGAKLWKFGTTPTMSSYLTSLCAGPFSVFEDEHLNADGRNIKMRVLARSALAEYVDADVIFGITKSGFDYYAKLFGVPFPYTKYDQVFMPQFNAGAMENIGNVTYRESYIFNVAVTDAARERRTITILHELAHMWFGNLVTMRWWNDLWLNESFAEYVSTLATAEATAHKNVWVQFNVNEKAWGLAQDSYPTTHPIAARIKDLNDVLVNFDGITYAKGAAVLQSLTNYCGRDKFFEGVGNYLRAFSYSNAELGDLLSELEKVTHKDLHSWSKYWIESAGPNTLSVDFEEKNGVFTKFDIIQSASEDHQIYRPHTLQVGLYNFTEDSSTYVSPNITATGALNLRGAKLHLAQSFGVEVDPEVLTHVQQLIGEKRPDMIFINDAGETFAKIRLDNISTEVALRYPHKIADPLTRGLILDALWFMVCDQKIDVEKYIDAVFKVLASETESITISTLIKRLKVAVFTMTKPSARVQAIKGAGTNLWNLAIDATESGDAQYQFVLAFTNFASTGSHISSLKELLNGKMHLLELSIDNKLQWDIRTALARLNAIDKPQILLARENDKSEYGRLGAASALAALNNHDAKVQAIESVYSKFSTLSNSEIEAVAAGFNDVIDTEHINDFVYEYFDRISEIWSEKDFAIAETILRGFYPSRIANLELAQLGEKWLDQNEHCPDALKRIVIENLDDTRRAIAVQKNLSKV